MRQEIPQLSFLLSEVEREIGHTLSTPSDFDLLAQKLEEQLHETVSVSTIKRLWGYVTSNPLPRIHTLDILSRFVGHKDFRSFCKTLTERSDFESSFFTTKYIAAKALKPGQEIRISWNPDRIVCLEYAGDCRFRVIKNINSQLREGDEFEQSVIMVGHPMLISGILRGGGTTDPYIAGSRNGITDIEIA